MTNQEWLQQNNAKIEEIKQLLEDKVIVAGAGSLLGSIIGGSSSASAQDRANKTNLQIARETNASNEKIWQNQANYQTQMWNETNEYNSPQKQKERLLAAGINPSAVLGNGSMAEASNLSAPSANPAVGAHVEPVNYAAGISNGSIIFLEGDPQFNGSPMTILKLSIITPF